ncbi:hypothetical protein FCS05_11750 [Deinococcus metallilatus]|uniref:Uncharacterized protein n=1 Tax=Deinococcus metallilatus TaxID=1211322 RepID=A0AAJ5F7J3_9DEIO|nr:hypothetical protein [Deinococcus metallilatus]TLK25722.1 hypothetical protein FCS05_11750 [Deinococcus metallilatus]
MDTGVTGTPAGADRSESGEPPILAESDQRGILVQLVVRVPLHVQQCPHLGTAQPVHAAFHRSRVRAVGPGAQVGLIQHLLAVQRPTGGLQRRSIQGREVVLKHQQPLRLHPLTDGLSESRDGVGGNVGAQAGKDRDVERRGKKHRPVHPPPGAQK